MSVRDSVDLELSAEAKTVLAKTVECLSYPQVLRTLANRANMSVEAQIFTNHLGKAFIYLRWLLEKTIQDGRLDRATLLAINHIEGELADAVTDNEGYGR